MLPKCVYIHIYICVLFLFSDSMETAAPVSTSIFMHFSLNLSSLAMSSNSLRMEGLPAMNLPMVSIVLGLIVYTSYR